MLFTGGKENRTEFLWLGRKRAFTEKVLNKRKLASFMHWGLFRELRRMGDGEAPGGNLKPASFHEEGNPAGLSSCSGGLRPLVELCVDP